MRVVRFIRRHPIALLGLFAIAFIVWLWRDSLPVAQPVLEPGDSRLPSVQGPILRRALPLPPGATPDPAKLHVPLGKGTVQALAKLKPGMTRAEVEQLVGTPAPEDILPATVSGGKVTYFTAYDADLGPLSTVRPITPHRSHPKEPPPGPKERTLVTLEFDATKPGHPLLGIHYPDPLF
jgi:hypothetical protein